MNQAQMRQTVVGKWRLIRRVVGAIRSIVNSKDLKPQCARVFNKTFLVPVLMYNGDSVMEREGEV